MDYPISSIIFLGYPARSATLTSLTRERKDWKPETSQTKKRKLLGKQYEI